MLANKQQPTQGKAMPRESNAKQKPSEVKERKGEAKVKNKIPFLHPNSLIQRIGEGLKQKNRVLMLVEV